MHNIIVSRVCDAQVEFVCAPRGRFYLFYSVGFFPKVIIALPLMRQTVLQVYAGRPRSREDAVPTKFTSFLARLR